MPMCHTLNISSEIAMFLFASMEWIMVGPGRGYDRRGLGPFAVLNGAILYADMIARFSVMRGFDWRFNARDFEGRALSCARC